MFHPVYPITIEKRKEKKKNQTAVYPYSSVNHFVKMLLVKLYPYNG